MRFPCVHAAASTPVQRLGVVLAHLTQPYQPSPIRRSGRPAHRPFRGLLGVHSRCGLHTRAVTNCGRYPKASAISSTSMTAPVASGWSDIAGWASHPLESAAFSRRTPIPALARPRPNREIRLEAGLGRDRSALAGKRSFERAPKHPHTVPTTSSLFNTNRCPEYLTAIVHEQEEASLACPDPGTPDRPSDNWAAPG